MNPFHRGVESGIEPKSQMGEINTLFTKTSPKKIESIAGYICSTYFSAWVDIYSYM